MNLETIFTIFITITLVINFALAYLCAKLYRLAYKDSLTGLWNSRQLYRRGIKLVKRCAKKNIFVGVFFIDLDNLKRINDLLSHAAGDAALRSLAKKLVGTFDKDTLVTRKSGDEFVVIRQFPSLEAFEASEESLTSRMRNIQVEWNEKGEIKRFRKKMTISATSGGVVKKAKDTTFADIMSEADKIMLARKKRRGSDL